MGQPSDAEGEEADNLFMHAASRAVVVTTLAALALAAGCAGEPVTLSLEVTGGTPDPKTDGVSVVDVTATVSPIDAVVSFVGSGGVLSANNVQAVDGSASVRLFAPFEFQVDGDVDALITGSVVVGEVTAADEVHVGLRFPTDGTARLSAHGDPDRVPAGHGAVMKLIIEGTRLTSLEATLSTDNDEIVLPPTVTLTQDGVRYVGSVDVVAPAHAAVVAVDITVGTTTTTAMLTFIGEDEAAFDLNGDFVEVVHGATLISDFWLLDGDNQCAVATSVSVVHMRQTGTEVEVTTEACVITMPEVHLQLAGTIRPTVGPGFVRAANERSTGPLVFDLPSLTANTPFAPDMQSEPPLIVGANVGDDEALPIDGADARVTDDDHDGQPGVTVDAFGERHTAYRTRVTSWTGTIESSNRVSGAMMNDTETVVFGGDGGGPVMTPKPSGYAFIRLDGKHHAADFRHIDGNPADLSCDDVKSWMASEMATEFPAPEGDAACN